MIANDIRVHKAALNKLLVLWRMGSFENGKLKAAVIPIDNLEVLEEMGRSKFQFRGIKS